MCKVLHILTALDSRHIFVMPDNRCDLRKRMGVLCVDCNILFIFAVTKNVKPLTQWQKRSLIAY